MIYGSVCSGIEAATVAWHPLGWRPAFFSEIDPFPRAVLTHHYPEVTMHGDFTQIGGDAGAIDLLVGGTPCQSFSVAGRRLGLDDPRGNLAIEYCRLALRLRPRWIVWENVPGVLSSNGGRDFGAFLGLLGECGYGWAYRVLDAQYVRVDGYPRAVPQRRNRVFVVGYLGDWRRAAAVLFEPEGMRGDPPPRRSAGAGSAAGTLGGTSPGGGWRFGPDEAAALRAKGGTGHGDFESETFVAAPLGFNGRQDPDVTGDRSGSINTSSPQDQCVAIGWAVRRLTPTECERLQGFPDGYTAVPYRSKPAADGPRYKALGNSMAVNVMRWIGRRIEACEAAVGRAAA